MFGRKVAPIQPKVINNEIFVQMSEPVEITGKTRVTVPVGYRAYAFVNNKHICRIDACSNKKLIKVCGRDYLGQQLSIAFVLTRTLSDIKWGFGGISVNNEAKNEEYDIGMRGTFSIEVNDHIKLIESFPGSSEITKDQIRDSLLAKIKAKGNAVFSAYFVENNVSASGINSLVTDELHKRLLSSINEIDGIRKMGVKVSSLLVEAIFIPEEDRERIRNMKNS